MYFLPIVFLSVDLIKHFALYLLKISNIKNSIFPPVDFSSIILTFCTLDLLKISREFGGMKFSILLKGTIVLSEAIKKFRFFRFQNKVLDLLRFQGGNNYKILFHFALFINFINNS